MTTGRTVTTSTVALCAYTEDRWDNLVAAVDSVARQQPHRPDEVIVVIDHNEALFSRARQELAGVDVCRSAGPSGLSGARNTAIERTTTDVLAFLDDDAVAQPDWLQRLLVHYADPRVLGVGGHARPVWEAGQPSWFPDEFLWVVGCSHRGLPTAVSTVRNVIGCNMSVRTEVLRKVGGFDVGLGRTADRPLGCEETDLCIRATELIPGGTFLLDPAAVVGHRVPRARGSWSYFLARCRAEGASKAWVARRVGVLPATATERRYVARTLPTAVGRGLRDVAHGDISGAGRVASVVAGLTSTSAAYALHRARPSSGASPRAGDAGPLATFVLNRRGPIPDIERSTSPDGTPYAGAHCVVLDGTRPVGVVIVPFDEDVLTASTLAASFAALPAPDPRPTARTPEEPVTVVIATRDRPGLLERCVRSVLAGSIRPDRIVVVDNAPSNDETATTARRLAGEFGEVFYVREDRPGLAHAHNRGLRHVETPLVAFTDDDVVVGEHWIAELQAAFASDPGIDCVTGSVVPLELDTATQRTIEAIAGFNKGWTRRVFDRGDRGRDPLFPYAAGVFGTGANMSFHTSHLRRAGGFDGALGTGTLSLGGDDLAAFYDVVAGGGRLCYEPAAFVRHQHHRDPPALARQAHGYGAGLAAHLTRCVVEDPRVVVEFGRAAAAGLRRARSISAPSAAPRELGLRTATIRGMASGGVRYLVARSRLTHPDRARIGWRRR